MSVRFVHPDEKPSPSSLTASISISSGPPILVWRDANGELVWMEVPPDGIVSIDASGVPVRPSNTPSP